MERKNKKTISRRDFLKIMGAGATVTAAGLAGCSPKNSISDSVSNNGRQLGEVPTDKMTYRITPNTGDKVSLLGYGCMRWPLKQKSDGSDEEVVDQEAVNDLVDYAIAHGVNYFDTAPPYVRGLSEAATGIALSRHPRDKYFIATKMSNQRLTDQGLSGEPLYKASVAMYRNSLELLKTDYLDYYLLHSIGGGEGDGTPLLRTRFFDSGVLDFMLKEREAGRIRNLGFSFHGNVKAYDYLLQTDIKWDFVQIQLNYIDWQHASGWNVNAEYLYGELDKRGIPAIIMEPLLGGRLSRIPIHAMEILKRDRPEDSAAAWAFRYAGTPGKVLTVLSGMVYMEHLQEDIITYSPLKPLNEAEYASLEQVTEIMLNAEFVQCTTCQYCMPCPYGLDIPEIFAHYNRCVSEGNRANSSGDENYRKARRAFLIGYDRRVPRLRQANHCIGCDRCKPNCPQRIDIPEEMQKIDRFVEQLKQGAAF
ncbi:MAG: aldo/keto reductase [Bacteroidales bacterium]|jgi:predicted aldo/keto reductase-like oxidoreductase|nr:aldo/keto reductase [Bacteroidales bacterium]